MLLSELEIKKSSIITNILAKGLLYERLNSLGFIKGNKISVIRQGASKKITCYEVAKSLVALRNNESNLIEVENK